MSQNARTYKHALAFPNQALSQLSLEVNKQLTLLAEIKAILPEDVGKHARHCVIGNKSLTVYTDSANWATQLRFYGEAMRNAAKLYSPAGQFSSLNIKVLPPLDSRRPTRRPNIPNLTATKALLSHSQSIHDPTLRASLEQLGATLARLNTENA